MSKRTFWLPKKTHVPFGTLKLSVLEGKKFTLISVSFLERFDCLFWKLFSLVKAKRASPKKWTFCICSISKELRNGFLNHFFLLKTETHMGHRAKDGKTVDEMSLL